MRRALTILGSAIFLVVAPGMVAGYLPWLICRWETQAAIGGIGATRAVGVALIAGGLPVLLDSFARFALEGLGTPAPMFPLERLVVSGLYRNVGNPMYVALTALILGEGLLFGSVGVLEYGVVVWAIFFFWVLVYEERVLRATCGREYERYCANVPRWSPKMRAWRDGKSTVDS